MKNIVFSFILGIITIVIIYEAHRVGNTQVSILNEITKVKESVAEVKETKTKCSVIINSPLEENNENN